MLAQFCDQESPNAMFELMLAITVGFYLLKWTGKIFEKPEKKSPEEEFGKALAKYLESGVKIKAGDDKKD